MYIVSAHTNLHLNSQSFNKRREGGGGGEGGAAILGGGAVDAGYKDAFLATTLTRVTRATVLIPVVVATSVFHSVPVRESVVGVVGPL